MAWKILGLIESRGGDLEILPAWCIGEPNSFDNLQHASLVRDQMQAIVDTQRAPRGAAAIEAPKLPPIKYMLVPAIDDGLIAQLHGKAAAPPIAQTPALSFGNGAPHP